MTKNLKMYRKLFFGFLLNLQIVAKAFKYDIEIEKNQTSKFGRSPPPPPNPYRWNISHNIFFVSQNKTGYYFQISCTNNILKVISQGNCSNNFSFNYQGITKKKKIFGKVVNHDSY